MDSPAITPSSLSSPERCGRHPPRTITQQVIPNNPADMDREKTGRMEDEVMIFN